MNVILSSDQIKKLEDQTFLLASSPALIEGCCVIFEQTLNDPQMVEWIKESKVAQTAVTRLTKNINNLRQMTALINKIVIENKNIIAFNQANNN